MKRFTMILVLTVTLSISVIAGEIPTVGFVPPPPPPAPSANVDGDMGASGFAEQITDEVVLAIFGIFAS